MSKKICNFKDNSPTLTIIDETEASVPMEFGKLAVQRDPSPSKRKRSEFIAFSVRKVHRKNKIRTLMINSCF